VLLLQPALSGEDGDAVVRDDLVMDIGGCFYKWLPRVGENLKVHLKNAFAEVAVGNFFLIKADCVKGKRLKDSDWFGELLEAFPKQI